MPTDRCPSCGRNAERRYGREYPGGQRYWRLACGYCHNLTAWEPVAA